MASEKGDLFNDREGLFLLAGLAFESHRYDHMLTFMKKLVEILAPSTDLSFYERHCFSTACALFLDEQLKSWRCVAKMGIDAISSNPPRANAAYEFVELIASEISKTCSDIVGAIDIILPPGSGTVAAAATAESRVFYTKMKGDYLRYKAEVIKGMEREKTAEASMETYMAAKEDAAELPATCTTRLELDLSLALFHADLHGSLYTALAIAKEAVDLATEAMKTSGETASVTTTASLKRLESSMDLWVLKTTGFSQDASI